MANAHRHKPHKQKLFEVLNNLRSTAASTEKSVADLNKRRDFVLERFFKKQCGSQTRMERGCKQRPQSGSEKY